MHDGFKSLTDVISKHRQTFPKIRTDFSKRAFPTNFAFQSRNENKNLIFSVSLAAKSCSISREARTTAAMSTKIMLIACGSFNPPTPMHLRMFGKKIIFASFLFVHGFTTFSQKSPKTTSRSWAHTRSLVASFRLSTTPTARKDSSRRHTDWRC